MGLCCSARGGEKAKNKSETCSSREKEREMSRTVETLKAIIKKLEKENEELKKENAQLRKACSAWVNRKSI